MRDTNKDKTTGQIACEFFDNVFKDRIKCTCGTDLSGRHAWECDISVARRVCYDSVDLLQKYPSWDI